MSKKKNILITGIPRSGTTLVTATIHAIPNCVALGEPDELKTILKLSASSSDFAERLQTFLQSVRRKILDGVPIPMRVDKTTQRVSSNYFERFGKRGEAQTVKTFEIRDAVIHVPNDDFTLCVKNNAQFTSCLSSLSRLPEISIIAVIRDPVASLLSWRSLNMPVSSGRLPAGERFSTELKKIAKLPDALLRQVKILDWFFANFYRCRDDIHIIRYEDFIANPDLLRQFIAVPEDHVFPKHRSMNKRHEYNFQEEDRLSHYLQRYTAFAGIFYPSRP